MGIPLTLCNLPIITMSYCVEPLRLVMLSQMNLELTLTPPTIPCVDFLLHQQIPMHHRALSKQEIGQTVKTCVTL